MSPGLGKEDKSRAAGRLVVKTPLLYDICWQQWHMKHKHQVHFTMLVGSPPVGQTGRVLRLCHQSPLTGCPLASQPPPNSPRVDADAMLSGLCTGKDQKLKTLQFWGGDLQLGAA